MPMTEIWTRTIRLTVLSPVHVGCAESYEPTGFTIDSAGEQLTVFDPSSFIAGLSPEDREEFSKICLKGTPASIVEIYRFVHGRPAVGRKAALCNGFAEHYRRVRGLRDERNIQQELNKFEIQRTSYLPHDGRPYLPGSAVKGALRTAWMNSLAEKNPQAQGPPAKKGPGKDAKGLEKVLMDDRSRGFEFDPFRLLKVSDFQPVGDIPVRVLYAVNKKKEPSVHEASGPYQILETIMPGASFVGNIRVEQPHRDAGIKNALDGDRLLSALAFFEEEKKREDGELGRIGARSITFDMDNGRSLIRLGRHSGAESVTIAGHRDIRIMAPRGGKTTSKPKATTLWLAAESGKPETTGNLKPFGWVALEVLAPKAIEELNRTEDEWRIGYMEVEADRIEAERAELEALAEARQRAAEEEAELEREREERQAEIARMEAKRAAMSKARIAAEDLLDPNISETRVNELFGLMSRSEGEDQIVLARALAVYWKDRDKWSKKKCSSNQWKKVRVVKNMVGE